MVEENDFVLVVSNNVLVIFQLHEGNLVFLTFLTVVLDLSISILQHFSVFPDFVLQTRPFILEPDCYLSYFTIYHTLSLTLHQIP